jgi:hypothetical protein
MVNTLHKGDNKDDDDYDDDNNNNDDNYDDDDVVEGGVLQVIGISFGHRFKRKEYSTSKRIIDRASTKV